MAARGIAESPVFVHFVHTQQTTINKQQTAADAAISYEYQIAYVHESSSVRTISMPRIPKHEQARPKLYRQNIRNRDRDRDGSVWMARACVSIVLVLVVLVAALQLLLLSHWIYNIPIPTTTTTSSTSTTDRTTTTTLTLRLESSSSTAGAGAGAGAGTSTSTRKGTTNIGQQEKVPPAASPNTNSSSSKSSSNHSSSSSSSFSFLYNQESDDEILHRLPVWIRDYVTWHSDMRRQFPGMELFTHPDAPPLLIRTCLGVCGGLHDRLGQLPWDLYLGHATKRILLMAWQRPRALEHFLIPNHPQLLDWRIPPDFAFGFDDMPRVRNFTELFEGFPEDHPTDDFWKHDIDAALERATEGGAFAHHKILRHRILGHLGEDALQERLNQEAAASNKDRLPVLADQVHAPPHFGRIFWLFFRPSPPVETWIRQIIQDLQLQQAGQYSAVHCRVRHPKATSHGWNVVGKNPKYPADKTGLPWEGDTRQFALDVATTALNCSRLILPLSSRGNGEEANAQHLHHPVYFLSDSNDLVRHVAIELADEQFVQANRTEIDQTLYQMVRYPPSSYYQNEGNKDNDKRDKDDSSLFWIRARDVTDETAHLDRQKGRPPPAYYSTFVDLMLVIHAHCVVYGIGYYAAFGAKISATPCQYLYQQEEWGHQAAKSMAQVCPNVLEERQEQQQQQKQLEEGQRQQGHEQG